MRLSRRCSVAVSILLLSVVGGCGGGGGGGAGGDAGGGGGGTPTPPASVVAGTSPRGGMAATGEPVTLTGSGFGAAGAAVLVGFHARGATPFVGGTSADAVSVGLVLDDAHLVIAAGPAAVPGAPVVVDVALTFLDGRAGASGPDGLPMTRHVRDDVAIGVAAFSQGFADVAVDPTDASRLVACGAAFDETSLWYRSTVWRSTDAGAHWVASELTDASDGLGERSRLSPRVAFDRHGRLHLAYVAIRISMGVADASLGVDVVAAESTDGGATWARSRVVATTPQVSFASVFPMMLAIAVGPDGADADVDAVHVAWAEPRPSFEAAIVVASAVEDGGTGAYGAFGASRTVASGLTPGVNEVDAAVGPDGQLAVAWTALAYTMDGDRESVYVDADADGAGATDGFSPTDTPLVRDPFGLRAVAPFLPPMQLPDGLRTGPILGVQLDFARSGPFAGRLYVVCTDAEDATADPVVRDVVVRWSDDLGATWAVSAPLGDATPGRSQWGPAISCDPVTGAPFVTWFEAVDVGGELLCERHGGSSADGGATWSDLVGADARSDFRSLSRTRSYPDRCAVVAVDGAAFTVFGDTSSSVVANPDGTARTDLYGTWID